MLTDTSGVLGKRWQIVDQGDSIGAFYDTSKEISVNSLK